MRQKANYLRPNVVRDNVMSLGASTAFENA